jgi:hypothetical protein
MTHADPHIGADPHLGSSLDQHAADAQTPPAVPSHDAPSPHPPRIAPPAPAAPEPNVILIGADWAERSLRRVRFARDLHAPLKLQVGNRYEHFQPTAERVTVNGRELHVFEWTTFTAVAE